MSRFPNKYIKLKHANGTPVSYGPLVNGLIDGIKVLAHKEILILLKAQLVPGKVKYFADHVRLRVYLSDQLEASIYAVHERDMHRLAAAFKRRHKSTMRQLLLAERDGGVSWENVPLGPSEDAVRMEEVHTRHRPKKVGFLKKLWLLVKRLSGKEEVSNANV